MKESTFDDSTLDNFDTNKSTVLESNIINTHEAKIGEMLDKSQSIVKQIKILSQEISNDLKSQNKLINEIGLTVNKTDDELKKNTSKIEQILLKTSTCSLIISAIIQVFVIIFLILL